MPARGDDHLVRVDGVRGAVLATDLDPVRRRELGVAGVVRDALPGDVLVVNSVQEAYVCVALGLERRPRELWLVLGKGEVVAVGGVAQLVRDIGGMPHDLSANISTGGGLETLREVLTFFGTQPGWVLGAYT